MNSAYHLGPDDGISMCRRTARGLHEDLKGVASASRFMDTICYYIVMVNSG